MARRTGSSRAKLVALEREIVACRRCPRLIDHCETVARTKKRAHRDETYWGRPIPGFGDPRARLVVIGLAPAAHGANRTGRVFTGDSSADWLYRALHKAGFASQPTSVSRDDGLELEDAWVTLAGRCAPPDNKPTRDELATCAPFLARELALLDQTRVVVALGKIAFDAWLALQDERPRPRPAFSHGAVFELGRKTLVASYHPSRQNTQTGRLTEPMLDAVFTTARERL